MTLTLSDVLDFLLAEHCQLEGARFWGKGGLGQNTDIKDVRHRHVLVCTGAAHVVQHNVEGNP